MNVNEASYTGKFAIRVLLKAFFLFMLFNGIYYITQPFLLLEHITIYNNFVPGRNRLPYASNNAAPIINISSLDLLFSTHTIAQSKASDEYRVILIGDSSIWGVGLHPNELMDEAINDLNYQLSDGKKLVVYNLAIPSPSIQRQMLLLEKAMDYEPDFIIWFMTLNTFRIRDIQLNDIEWGEISQIRSWQETYDLQLPVDSEVPQPCERCTFFQQRVNITQWILAQAYGIYWGLTEQDQAYGLSKSKASDKSKGKRTLQLNDITDETTNTEAELDDILIKSNFLPVIIQMTHDLPILIINQPMFAVDESVNKQAYNQYYPRWAYDHYRQTLYKLTSRYHIPYVDAWNILPNDLFTDNPFHYNYQGILIFRDYLMPYIIDAIENNREN